MNSTVVCCLIIIFLVLLINFNQIENFYTGYIGSNYFLPRYCGYCGYQNIYECKNCTNCGVCTTADGRSECINGDITGPYFREDCVSWEYQQQPPTTQVLVPSYYPTHIFPSLDYRYGR
jgi:hypothetical protein